MLKGRPSVRSRQQRLTCVKLLLSINHRISHHLHNNPGRSRCLFNYSPPNPAFPTFGGPVPELSAVDRDNGSLSKYLGDKGSNTSKVLTRMTTAALRVTAKGLRGLHSPGFPTHPALHLIPRKPAQTSSWQMPPLAGACAWTNLSE